MTDLAAELAEVQAGIASMEEAIGRWAERDFKGVVTCPLCGGTVTWSRTEARRGTVGQCSTPGCLAWGGGKEPRGVC